MGHNEKIGHYGQALIKLSIKKYNFITGDIYHVQIHLFYGSKIIITHVTQKLSPFRDKIFIEYMS